MPGDFDYIRKDELAELKANLNAMAENNIKLAAANRFLTEENADLTRRLSKLQAKLAEYEIENS